MIETRDDIHAAYAQIKKGADDVDGALSVVIFTAVDCDSLCACHIFKEVLAADFIQNTMQPVGGYEDLKVAAGEMIKTNEELRSIVLINCGANINILEFLDIPEESPINVYVLDSHRPVQLDNAFAPDRVFVFDDGSSRESVMDIKDMYFNYVKFFEGRDDELTESDSDSGSDSDGGDAEAEGEAKRQKGDPRRVAMHEARRQIREYYEKCFYGMPVSMYVWTLAVSLSRDSPKLLWWVIVGMTDGYINDRIGRDDYELFTAEMQADVVRLIEAPDEGDLELDDRTIAAVLSDGQITFVEQEYRLMCYRHWTLYDSLFHSPYVATRLGVWKEDGRRRLDGMLAKMGFPLRECTQTYQYMRPELKETLRQRLKTFKDEYGLQELFFGSFSYKESCRAPVSAADMAYALNAMLIRPDQQEPEVKGAEDDDDREMACVTNFNLARETLVHDHWGEKELSRSLKKACELQELIVQEGISLIEKDAVMNAGKFNYAYINQSSNQRQIAQPVALVQLAHFLVEAAVTLNGNKRRKPLVLCAANPSSDPETYTVIGVTEGQSMANRRNHFGTTFRKVADQTRVRMRQDAFDTANMEVLKSDMPTFMEYLQLELEEA